MYYFKRLISLIITLFLVSFVAFAAFSIIPGDAALAKLSMDAEEEELNSLRESLGLNDSLFVRYGRYMKGAIKGDYGNSIQYGTPVAKLISERLPVTLWLAVLSMLMIISISLPLGVLASLKSNGVPAKLIIITAQIFMAIPAFFLGIIITIIFGLLLKWFIPGAYVPLNKDVSGFFKYIIYPAAAVAIPKIAMTVRFFRSKVLKELDMDYVRTAKSKGNSKVRILFIHVIKNAMIPVITFIGMMTADVLAGSIIIEQVFNLPGMGRLLVTAISNRDYPVVLTAVLYIAAVIMIINFIVDITYKKIDPRVRLAA